MRVALVASRYYPSRGGIENHIKNLAERLIKKIDVEVYTIDSKDSYEEINGIFVHRFKPRFRLGSIIEVPSDRLINKLKQSNYDIIHMHNLHTLLPYYVSKYINSSRIIITSHYHGRGSTAISNILFRVYKTRLQSVIDKSSKIISVSTHEYNLLNRDFNIKHDKIVIIPNGIDKELLSLTKNINKDPRKILFVGRFVKYKNAHKIIEAMQYLKDYRLTLVGDGKEKYNLIKLIDRLNLNDRVRLRVNIPKEELAREYASSSIFVLPSEIEAQGIVVMEALIFRLKTIVAYASALREYVDNGYAYGIDTPITAKKIADAVMNIDTYSFKPYRAYSWDEVVERVLRVYEKIANI